MKNRPCETCEYRGYSPEVCRVHVQKMLDTGKEECGYYRRSLRKVARRAAVGAGAGIAAAACGIGIVPVLGIKAVMGHALAAKVAGGGGVVGAGVNVIRKWRGKQSERAGATKGWLFQRLSLRGRR